jgi:hypothetical protein
MATAEALKSAPARVGIRFTDMGSSAFKASRTAREASLAASLAMALEIRCLGTTLEATARTMFNDKEIDACVYKMS